MALGKEGVGRHDAGQCQRWTSLGTNPLRKETALALEMKPNCLQCGCDLATDGVAFICSYECTFCPSCADASVACQNCGGELMPRPRRELTASSPSMRAERLQAFNQAWGEADLDGLLKLMAEDPIYAASTGPEPGKTYVGREEVARGFQELLAYEAGSEAGEAGPLILHGHRGFCQWSYWKTLADGRRVEVKGCDVFEFEGNRIRRKEAYVKSLPLE